MGTGVDVLVCGECIVVCLGERKVVALGDRLAVFCGDGSVVQSVALKVVNPHSVLVSTKLLEI